MAQTADSAAAFDPQALAAQNSLRSKVRQIPTRGPDDDPVARAEAAMLQLSSQFAGWMDDEVLAMQTSWEAARAGGLDDDLLRDAFFRAVHDIKGQAAIFGFPLAAAVASSLCLLIEEASEPASIPAALIDHHVEAIRAIVRENARGVEDATGVALAARLDEATRAFLARQIKA